MTERIDLRALEPDRVQAERVVQAAIARASLGIRVIPWLAGRARPILAAAAVLLLVAYGLLRNAPRQPGPVAPTAALAGWVAAGHVPTNGEILTAYRGYQP